MTLAAGARAPSASARLVAVDALRGFAMFMVCIGHFGSWLLPRYPQLSDALIRTGRIATPLFLLLSGAMIGLVRVSNRQIDARGQRMLIDRGLFILIVAHVAIALSSLRLRQFSATVFTTYTTDAIAIACLIAAALPRYICRVSTAWVAAGCFVLSWLIAVNWLPVQPALVLAKQLLIGQPEGYVQVLPRSVALLPDIAICLMGVPLGQYWNTQLVRNDGFKIAGRALLKLGMASIAAAATLRLLRTALPEQLALEQAWRLTAAVTHKIPPSPAYLLFFGGSGLLMGGLIFRCWEQQRFIAPLHKFAELGQASLAVFILQFFIIWTLPDWLGLTPTPYSAALLPIELALVWLVARGWNAMGGNRWFTLGLYRKPATARAGGS